MRRLLAVIGCLAMGPGTAAAQVLRGDVLEEGTGAPVGGAMVVLLEVDGEPVRRVLTDARGAFITQAPHPGRYALRVERIGYASLVTEPFDLGPAGAHRTVEVPLDPVELTDLDVSGERRCEVRPEEGRVTARIWEEARKALQAAAWTEEAGLYRYTLLHYVRDLDRDAEKLESEEREFIEGPSAAPFVSLPVEELIEEGFVQVVGDTMVSYFAPDAAAFLSEAFLDTHCMGVRAGDDGLVGLTFAPVEGRRLPDIEGTLWIDERSAHLRRLDFTYVNLGRNRRLGTAGGEVVFAALPNGTWIVREFRIRMPELEGGRGFRRGVRRVGYRDEGGVAWRIVDHAGRVVLDAEKSTLFGTVVDSTGAPPELPARVRVPELGLETRTEPDGTFLFGGLPPGLHTLDLRHLSLDTLGLPVAPVRAQAVVGEIVPVRLKVPTISEVLEPSCATNDVPMEGGLLFGRVTDDRGLPVWGARVRVFWLGGGDPTVSALAAPPGSAGEAPLAWSAAFDGAYQVLETTTDGRGIFMLCHAPAALLRLEARREGWRGAVRRVRAPGSGELRVVRLTIQDGRGP